MPNVLVISPHPDDAELAMAGVILKMVAANFNILIIDLTDGEPTPHGCRETRLQESANAAKILKINRICLDMRNRFLRPTLKNRYKLAEIIRQHKPDIIFGPALPDFHPDHINAAALIEYSRFDAKLHKTKSKFLPHWTKRYYKYYSPHRNSHTNPAFIIDITQHWNTKQKSIQAYQSQLSHLSPSNNHVSLLEKVKITNEYFGLLIGTKFAEAFESNDPISFKNINELL